jgi:hypothetical protein
MMTDDKPLTDVERATHHFIDALQDLINLLPAGTSVSFLRALGARFCTDDLTKKSEARPFH